jgi:uroporphyrinogen decarboxylase
MNGRERISRQLKRLPVDRIGAGESFWSFTAQRWIDEGRMPRDVSCADHFDLDIEACWALRLAIDPVFQPRVIAEDADTQTLLDGNGARLRRHRHHASTPEHIGYAVATRADWEEKARPFLTPSDNRLDLAGYSAMRAACAKKQRFFCYGGVNVFEAIHPVCGHENMLVGMALDPGWIADMASTFADLMIALFEQLFARAGKPDGIWFFEDMGFKGRPFMSPAMYRELILPAHRKTIAFAHAAGLPVIMHSCGFVEPLLPGMVEAGIDALQAIEVKAGMDLLRIYERFGDRIALMGGLDVRPIAANDREGVRRELEWKIPIVRKRNGFILHSDHSIPESTDYDTYRYFLDLGRQLGTYGT